MGAGRDIVKAAGTVGLDLRKQARSQERHLVASKGLREVGPTAPHPRGGWTVQTEGGGLLEQEEEGPVTQLPQRDLRR